jgi:hypothetical protein
VTEILVRPLLSLFFPQLASMYQPCSGECAGRRELFEQLPFSCGYGIETGMLIDIYHQFGREVMGQTNLDLRSDGGANAFNGPITLGSNCYSGVATGTSLTLNGQIQDLGGLLLDLLGEALHDALFGF